MLNPLANIDLSKFKAAAFGQQDLLCIVGVPAGVDESWIGTPLLGKTLAVNGDYYCLIPLSGMASAVQVHLRATLAGGATVTTELASLYYLAHPETPSTYVAKTGGTGDGLLVSATIQTSTLTVAGEQFAMVKLTVAAAGTAVITLAEYNGL